jgi:hypothetical protein
MTKGMAIKFITLLEGALFLLPLSLLWLFGVTMMVLARLDEISHYWTALPSAGTLLLILWLSLCGAGLFGLWDLFLHYQRYQLKTLPWKIKLGIPLGFVGALPFAIGLHWKPIFIFIGIPLAIVIQFYALMKVNSNRLSAAESQ